MKQKESTKGTGVTMKLCHAVLLVVKLNLCLFSGSDAESCQQDLDCRGYTVYVGIRCISGVCECNQDDACTDYDAILQQANQGACQEPADCIGYYSYFGIVCVSGACQCIKHFGCGECYPAPAIEGAAIIMNDICVFDHYSEVPSWSISLSTDVNRIGGDESVACPNIVWDFTSVTWTIYKVYKENDFRMEYENILIEDQVSNDGSFSFDSPDVYAVGGLKFEVDITSNLGFDDTAIIQAYYLKSCAYSFEETNDQRYQASDPVCSLGADQISGLGYQYPHQVPSCTGHVTVNEFVDRNRRSLFYCRPTVQCASGTCPELLNPLEETEFHIDVGCAFTVEEFEVDVKNCRLEAAYSCTEDGVIDISSQTSRFRYKPEEENLSWNFHGLSASVYLHLGKVVTGILFVQYGDPPTTTEAPVVVAGDCDIVPKSGYSLTTPYNITCPGFTTTQGIEYKYSLFAHHEQDYEQAVKLYTGVSPNVSDIYLLPGREATDYTVYVWVKAFSGDGAFAIEMIQTQVYPVDNMTDVAESFVALDVQKNSSLIGDLISVGGVDAAGVILGSVTSVLNLDAETEKEADSVGKRTNIRTAVVDVLIEMPLTDLDGVSLVTGILNKNTGIKEEISKESQGVASELYSNLADGFYQTLEQRVPAEVFDTGSSILHGMGRILDMNIDTLNVEVENVTATETATEETEFDKVKTKTAKLVRSVDTVMNGLIQKEQPGASTRVIVTETMTVGIQKVPESQLSTALSYNARGSSNSTGNIRLPDISKVLSISQDLGIKMLYMEKNPYVWDNTSKSITSPIMSISLLADSSPVVLNDLTEPVTLSLSNLDKVETNATKLFVLVQKNGESLTVLNSTIEGINMLGFNITDVPERIICLNVIPVADIAFRMLIKTDELPEVDEIITEGFLYPDEIPRSLFANQSILKTDYVPQSLNERGKFFLAPSNSLSENGNFSGLYYFGLTLDLTHERTVGFLQREYRACLGSRITVCQQLVALEVDIKINHLGCLYWDEGNQIWSSQGCEVSPNSSGDITECLCTHLTAFGGSNLPFIVMPNLVDPGDLTLFLTFFDNPVVVTAVIVVWVIYFFLIHWARQADKKDLEKVGVINCTDNSPTDNYLYLVCIVTGWWKDAGTSANVFIFLKGSKGSSSTHCLTASPRPCFQSGSEDWFLVTTEQSLGYLQTVTVWHDNMGAGPHWYLNHVYVRDIQLQKSWHFIYNDWLAVNKGTLLQTAATLEAVTEKELKFKQKHNFMVKSTHDLRDSHLWLSIFSKPARSPFTRVQRLTCALSLLLTTMLTNIMFYGIPTDDPADQGGMVGDISISLSAIVIGIESSLIMFPVNLLILQLFLKIKLKPKSGETKILSGKKMQKVQKINQASKRITEMVMLQLKERIYQSSSNLSSSDSDLDKVLRKNLNVNAKGPPSSRRSRRKSSVRRNPDLSTTSLRASSEKGSVGKQSTINLPKNPRVLPWWFLYIAWFLVLAVSIISSYFVMLYGLKYGYNKSVSWLVSFFTGFTQSAFVTQPVKVICVAVIVTLIFKKPAEYDDFGPDIALDKDEVYLHEVSGAKEMHHPTVEPLSKSLLAKIRQRLYVEWLMDMTIRDIVLYVIYVAVVMFMVHGHRNINLAYRNNVAIKDVLVAPSCIEEHECYSLEEVGTVEGMFEYLREVLTPTLTDMSVADHEYATVGSSHFLLGPFRLRQQRVQKGLCLQTKQSIVRRFGQDFPECSTEYSMADEDTGSYNNSWQHPLSEPSSGIDRWTYSSGWKLKTIPYSGDHAFYSGGGFVLEMPPNVDYPSMLNDIHNTGWIDERTRSVFVEFTLYNSNVDLFSVVVILFEFTNVGGVFPNHQIFTTKLYHYSSNLGPYLVLCEVLFLCFNIAFTYIEVKRYRKIGRKEYFKDKWSYLEVLQLAFSYTVVALFFQRLVSVSSILDQYRDSQGQKFVSFYTAVALDITLGYVMAFQVAVVTLRSVKLLRFNKRTFLIGDTIAFSKYNLISFLFMFAIFIVAFSHFTNLAFGSVLNENKSFSESILSLFNFAIDSSDLLSLYGVNRILGPLYFIVFVVFTQWCLMTVFVAILNFGLSDAKAKAAQRQSRFELMEYIVKRIKNLI